MALCDKMFDFKKISGSVFRISITLSFLVHHQGPPRVSERVAHRQSIRLGRTMKLPCPVEGDPPPLIMWTKDGRNIHSGWTRFRGLQHGLRIKEVETDDAGTYICKATNGFGSVNINYTLIVIGTCPNRTKKHANTDAFFQPFKKHKTELG